MDGHPRSPFRTSRPKASVYKNGDIDRDIGYVECHGTGTKLGDPVELHALTDSFAGSRSKPSSAPLVP